MRNWGKKVVVVIDRYFFDNMNELTDAYARARNDQERRDNADVVWHLCLDVGQLAQGGGQFAQLFAGLEVLGAGAAVSQQPAFVGPVTIREPLKT